MISFFNLNLRRAKIIIHSTFYQPYLSKSIQFAPGFHHHCNIKPPSAAIKELTAVNYKFIFLKL